MIKLRIESEKEEIRKYTDLLTKIDTLEVKSISPMYPVSQGMSVYCRCFCELELKETNNG